jgi:hypothetical protein
MLKAEASSAEREADKVKVNLEEIANRRGEDHERTTISRRPAS